MGGPFGAFPAPGFPALLLRCLASGCAAACFLASASFSVSDKDLDSVLMLIFNLKLIAQEKFVVASSANDTTYNLCALNQSPRIGLGIDPKHVGSFFTLPCPKDSFTVGSRQFFEHHFWFATQDRFGHFKVLCMTYIRAKQQGQQVFFHCQVFKTQKEKLVYPDGQPWSEHESR